MLLLDQRHNRQLNDTNSTSLGFLVRFARGVFKINFCQAKTQNNNQTYINKWGDLLISLHGEQSPAAEQVWYVGIQDRILFGLILFL